MSRAIALAILVMIGCGSAASAGRIEAAGNITVYIAPAKDCANGYFGDPSHPVTTCGDDENGDGSTTAPWATPQRAIDEFYRNYDFRGQYAPTIQLACAAAPAQFFYAGVRISGLLLGQPGGAPSLLYGDGSPPFVIGEYRPVSIIGCPSYPAGAVINPGAGGRPSAIGLSVAGGAVVKVAGVQFDTTHAQQDCVDVFTGAALDISDVIFGNASNDLRRIQVGVAWGGTLVVNGTLTVAGNASSFIETGSAGTVYWNNNGNPASPMIVRVVGQPQFSNGMINSSKGMITIANVKFLDENGKRARVVGTVAVAKFNGIIDTGTGNGTVNGAGTCNPNYFPLNTAPGGIQVDVQDNATCR